MCGIAGLLQLDDGQAIDAGTLRQMTGTLAHRGPDGDGYFLTQSVGLGHRRLSIIDIAGGDQPIFNEDESIVVVFNGEIYNYKELRDGLRARGHTLRTNADTEVIVHLYEDYGDDFLLHLNGMFAIALWDSNRQRLILARDRLGEKPLYYAKSGGTLVFGSELKSILQFPSIDAEIDLNAIDDYLAYGYVPAPSTIYKQVQKLPAAHRLVAEAGRYRVDRYWAIEDERISVPTEPNEAIAALRSLLEDAVRIRLRSDVPVGAFLSGGIDSSLIVALAARQQSDPLQTFTVGFPGADQDETEDAAVLARHCSTRHTEIPLAEIDLDLLPSLVAQFDEPFADPSSVPTFLVTREASRFVKVCLSGDGGDELFGGYRRYRYEPLERQADAVPRPLRRALFGTAARLLPAAVPGAGWLDRLAVDGAERLQRKVGVFTPRERALLWREEFGSAARSSSEYLARHYPRSGGSVLEERMAADRATYLPEDVLTKVDRMSMANSLEVRVPILDHRVAAFSAKLDYGLKFRDGQGKFALREIARTLIPAEVLERPKRGFGMPIRRWHAAGMLDPFLEMLTDSSSRVSQYLNADEIRPLAARRTERTRDASSRLWALLWLELWLRAVR